MQTVTTGDLLNKKELIKDIIQPTRRRKRFFNYVVDIIFFYMIMLVVGIIWGGWAIATGETIDESASESLLLNFISMGLFLAYYITFESFFGKTIGKMVTNTKVVMTDGSKPALGTIVKRTFIRIIPFEFVSLFSPNPRGWHDSWSDTMVVDDISLYRVPTNTSGEAKKQEEF